MQRYHPETDTVRIACDRFPFKEQNEQYLRDVLNKLLKEAEQSPEEFSETKLIHAGRPKRIRRTGPPSKEWIQSMTENK
jgi:hypothetical protein